MNLDVIIHHLRAIDDLRGIEACLLIKCILHEFFLEPVILELLFLAALALLIQLIILDSKLSNLFLLFLLNGNILKNQISSFNMLMMTFAFQTQELLALLLSSFELLVTGIEAIFH